MLISRFLCSRRVGDSRSIIYGFVKFIQIFYKYAIYIVDISYFVILYLTKCKSVMPCGLKSEIC